MSEKIDVEILIDEEQWETQTTFNEEDIDIIIEDGGDIDEATNNDTK